MGFCPECGPCRIDDDGCCVQCGATATGKALSQMLAENASLREENAALRAENARLRAENAQQRRDFSVASGVAGLVIGWLIGGYWW